MSTEKVASNCVPAPRLTRILCFAKAPKPKPIFSHLHIPRKLKWQRGISKPFHVLHRHPQNQSSPYLFCIFAICTFAHATKTQDHHNVLHPRQLPGSLRSSLPRRLQWWRRSSPNGLHFNYKCLKGSCFSFQRHFVIFGNSLMNVGSFLYILGPGGENGEGALKVTVLATLSCEAFAAY